MGPIEERARADIAALVTSHPMGETLAELAYSNARQLDRFDLNQMARAGISKELRETVCELARLAEGDSDDISAALSVPTTFRDGS